MPGNRTLLPAPSALDGVLQSRQRTADKSIATNKAGAPGKKIAKQRRHRHSSREWEDLKERFAELYKDEDLPGVMKIIRQEFGFEASLRQYKNKIKEWGLKKHIKAVDMQILAAKRLKRARDRGVETVFMVRGMSLDHDRLERFIKREANNIGAQVSPSTDTPAQVTYYTPQSPINQKSPNVGTSDIFVKGICHHYSKVGAITVVQVNVEEMHEGTKQSMLSFQHAHQQAGHGIACRGRFSDVQKTEELLWQAQRLIVDIENPLLIRQVGIPVQAPLSPESSAPRDYRYWVSPHETDDKKSRRFVDCIKNSKLCQYLLGAEDHGSRSSRQGWQLMNSTEAADAESAGRKLFGHPAVAYPDMEILTLLIRCDDTASEAKSALLRICICVDPASERRSCQICHSICMILDFIDEEGAVKLNIPLSDTSFPKSVSDLAEGPDYFSTSTWTRNATWADVDFLFQGMTKLQPHCYSHKMTKKNWILHDTHSSDMEDEEDRWDPDGNADSSIFEPVSDNRSSLFCLERNRLVNHDDEWDSDCGSSYTDEESPFEPFPDH